MTTEEDLDGIIGQMAMALEELDSATLTGELERVTVAKGRLESSIVLALRSGSSLLLDAAAYALDELPTDDRVRLLSENQEYDRSGVLAAYTLPPEKAAELLDERISQDPSEIDREELLTVRRLPFLQSSQSSDSSSTKVAPSLQPSRARSLTTIIHGTFASHATWWQPGGSFAANVAANVDDFYMDTDYFKWTGKNSDQERRLAADELKDWIETHLEPGGSLTLLCHSHGGNVAMLVTRLGIKITKLVLLGTPIRTDYVADMRNIGTVFNLYVPWDTVQTTFGTRGRCRGEGRTLADTDKILNVPVTVAVGGRARAHSALHNWKTWQANDLDKQCF